MVGSEARFVEALSSLLLERKKKPEAWLMASRFSEQLSGRAARSVHDALIVVIAGHHHHHAVAALGHGLGQRAHHVAKAAWGGKGRQGGHQSPGLAMALTQGTHHVSKAAQSEEGGCWALRGARSWLGADADQSAGSDGLGPPISRQGQLGRAEAEQMAIKARCGWTTHHRLNACQPTAVRPPPVFDHGAHSAPTMTTCVAGVRVLGFAWVRVQGVIIGQAFRVEHTLNPDPPHTLAPQPEP